MASGMGSGSGREETLMRRNVAAYRVMAYVTGVMLIILCTVAVLQLVINDDGLVHAVGLTHGLLYVVYLLVSYPLTRRLRLGNGPTVMVLLAGTVPVMTFVVERRVSHRYIGPALAGPAAGAGPARTPAREHRPT
jgi:integral membrane protein